MDEPAIETNGIRKLYRSGDTTTGLRGVDLVVPAGEVHGLLGHNGAGKTTLVRILATLLRPDGGSARVAGIDVRRDPAGVRRRMAVVGQGTSVDEDLGGRANLVLFGRLQRLDRATAVARTAALLDEFGLTEAADRPVSGYSGGMRRRLDLAVALVARPRVLFVDEPTTGLDPTARGAVWQVIAGLAATGTTVLLTTQYLDEADALADRITLLADGRVAAEGTPAELKARVGVDVLTLAVPHRDLPVTAAAAERFATGPVRIAGERVHVPVADRAVAGQRLLTALTADGVTITAFDVAGPTLDDVFQQFATAAEEVSA